MAALIVSVVRPGLGQASSTALRPHKNHVAIMPWKDLAAAELSAWAEAVQLCMGGS